MSTLTANYGFQKDDPLEQYNVGVVNSNLDLVDAAIKAVSNAGVGLDAAMDTRVDALELDSATVITTMLNAAVWDHVAGHSLRYRKVSKLVKVTGMVQWKSGVLATSNIVQLPVGFRPPFPEWCTSKANLSGGNDTVADFMLDTTGNLLIPATAYYQGAPVVNIVFPLSFSFFI